MAVSFPMANNVISEAKLTKLTFHFIYQIITCRAANKEKKTKIKNTLLIKHQSI